MKTYLFLIFSLLIVFSANGQSPVELSQLGIFSAEDYSQAKVYFKQESKLKEILISKTNASKTRQVWRVRIYMGSGKNARVTASSTRNAFVARYPEVSADIVYPSPYFKVQVGDFKTRIEAESFKNKIKNEYQKSRVELVTINGD